MPSSYCDTTLFPIEFIGKLRLHYLLSLLDSLLQYNICITRFSVPHTLSSKVGGLIRTHYDNSRNILSYIVCTEFWLSNTYNEPLIISSHTTLN